MGSDWEAVRIKRSPTRAVDLAETEEEEAEEAVGPQREGQALDQPVRRARHRKGPRKHQRAAGPVPRAVRRAHSHEGHRAQQRVGAVVERLAHERRRQRREVRLPQNAPREGAARVGGAVGPAGGVGTRAFPSPRFIVDSDASCAAWPREGLRGAVTSTGREN